MLNSNESQDNFYIAKRGSHELLGGVGVQHIPVWRGKQDYSLARRFSTVDSAVRFAEQNRLSDIRVIDRLGNVLERIDDERFKWGGGSYEAD